ncbi:hypothetical protein [Erwinia pyrifoliae]|uniref:Uncharacterized protein n=1 Tax=Erwinia pyrifoliae TaxID=79967 RepID=A0ABY5XDN6_ERWPY|nr:hypothetical protein [Erwinia pyrifoliae]UWS31820.1 hypothetical protein NYP81_13630 [Erwinia pyrifoliae]UWS35466.1 hypothetical protein NYP84_16970 [Erwinia pyrifoliae]UXK14243.1 hypothetical protein NYP80_16950 [Erwinia pyrifoliae]
MDNAFPQGINNLDLMLLSGESNTRYPHRVPPFHHG